MPSDSPPSPSAWLRSRLASLRPSGAAGRLSASSLLAAGLVLAGAWLGGWWGVALASSGLLAGGLSRPREPGHTSVAMSDADPLSESTSSRAAGMHALVNELTEEWGKQLTLGREHNKDGLEQLLITFSSLSEMMVSMSSRLANFRPNVAAGVVGEAVDSQRPALDELMAPLQRAFEQREAMRAQLKACTDALGSLLQWSKGARELAQHTRMVAFNASIEAVRGCGGAPEEMAARQTISTEIRRVSESIIALCDAMDQMMQPLHEAGHTLQQQALIQDTNDEQLRLELELRARHAIGAMFESLGGSITSGSDLLEASEAIASRVEEAFTQFQFGDRVEQMLQILNRDINRLGEYAASGQQPTSHDVKRWLEELAANYTMDEQRSQHHNTELVDRSSRVEFF